MSHRRNFVPTRLWLAALALLPALAQAGSVLAEVPGATDSSAGAVANASAPGFAASTTRTSQTVSAAVAGGSFTDLAATAHASASSGYEFVGLDGVAPVTFTWELTGSRSWNADNAKVGAALSVYWFARNPSFIHNVSWSISYVDAAPAFGDFAGVLTAPVAVQTAGAPPPVTLAPGLWGGTSTVRFTTTMEAASGNWGDFSIETALSLAGDAQGSLGLRLVSATVPGPNFILASLGSSDLSVETVLTPNSAGAYLLLDDGQRVAITAVPEPRSWALMLLGLGAVGLSGLRRRRPQR